MRRSIMKMRDKAVFNSKRHLLNDKSKLESIK